MKTTKEFNEKYKDFLEEGHPGLTIEMPSIVLYLDSVFQDLIKIPNFKYSHIKTVFGLSRFFNNLAELMPFVGRTMDNAIEERINFLIKLENEIRIRLENQK